MDLMIKVYPERANSARVIIGRPFVLFAKASSAVIKQTLIESLKTR